eukprot:3941644-Rhodomonas_salina.16
MVACAENLQWGQEVNVDEGSGDKRVRATIDAEGQWYQWNQMGDPEGKCKALDTGFRIAHEGFSALLFRP